MTIPLPRHKHIPGVNARHPEGAFDDIRAQAAPVADNPAWLYGLRLLREGYYWEAHEVLEPVWMDAAPNSAARLTAQAVIQLANAALKRDMGKPRAAARLAAMVDDLAARAAAGGDACLGLSLRAVRQAAAEVAAGAAGPPQGL